MRVLEQETAGGTKLSLLARLRLGTIWTIHSWTSQKKIIDAMRNITNRKPLMFRRLSGCFLTRQPFLHRAYHFFGRGQNAECCSSAAIDHQLAINEDLVLAVTTMLRVDLYF